MSDIYFSPKKLHCTKFYLYLKAGYEKQQDIGIIINQKGIPLGNTVNYYIIPI